MEIVMQALNHGVIMTTARDYTGATKYMVQYGLQFTVFDSFREALQDYTQIASPTRKSVATSV